MKKEFIDSLIIYIDKVIEYEFSSRESDEEGYTSSCVTERKAMESAKKKLYDLWGNINDR